MKRHARLLLIPALLLLGSCALFTKSKDRRTVYALRPIEQSAMTSKPTLSAHVTSVQLPGYLDRSEFVARASANELDVRDHHIWGDSLEQEIARVLAANLRTLTGSSYIIARDSNLPRRKGTFRIDLEITSFEPTPDNAGIEFNGLYSIRSDYDPQPVRIHSFSINVPQQAPATTKDNITGHSVEAMNSALDELSVEITKALISRS